MPILQFSPLLSSPSPAFFQSLSKHKLEIAKLDDRVVAVQAEYTESRFVRDREKEEGEEGDWVGLPGTVDLGAGALDPSMPSSTQHSVPISGILKNYNTIEEFKSADKQAIFQDVVDLIKKTSDDGLPSLSPFLLLTFSDLKKYKFYYWFAFPGIVQKPAWHVTDDGWKSVPSALVMSIRSQLPEFKALHPTAPRGSYLMRKVSNEFHLLAPLTSYQAFFQGTIPEERYLVFSDPSALPQNPGWPLRNDLFYLSSVHGCRSINVIGLRGGEGASIQGTVFVPEQNQAEQESEVGLKGEQEVLKAVGWEKNEKGKLGPRVVDLGASMDPTRLAAQAVDLNLKLMRWRILPELDLEKISGTKCLLLGAGTLGCYVSRVLMGWGVRTITFADSATVSFSNPVRQPLFEFEDSLNGGKDKAPAAADALKRIFPGVNATGHTLSIPMPGHPISPSSLISTQESVSKLEDLIDSHDVIFLLMDSRESRWLPTLLGAARGKIVINAALGFDSYLVMRHGEGPSSEIGKGDEKRSRLACYFCQDSNALGNSLNDRTLDQMCTVSRPGLAPIASATAVELLVALLCHPEGIAAPADKLPSKTTEDLSDKMYKSPLGMVPHQLRGGLSTYQTLNLSGEAFELCTACSSHVIDDYRSKGFSMLLESFNDPTYLPRLTGLDKLNEETEGVMKSLDWEDDEGDL
ncbi:Ubiquitin activating E1 enzyme-like protein [Phaffia rhodozyma]|uniref:Ubiquitin-like modifier-activating enzyme ATG7 n=1 Tax=Phaffia rhodozyma TaxID=264483 RepID=A0A0F7SSC5_PHARH|nr:Ubiquitin activating E1 enzyme-like protein [Phaffia rhodozyma]